MKNILLGFIVIISFSCKKGNTDPGSTNNQDPLIPLKIGNSWTYTEREYNESGSVTSTQNIQIIVSGQITRHSKTYFVLTLSNDPTDTAFLWRSEGDKIFSPLDSPPYEGVFLKWPASDGEKIFSIDDGGGYIEESVMSTAPVTVNGFEGHKLTYNIYYNSKIDKYNEIFFKPGLGIIGINDYSKKLNIDQQYKFDDIQLITYDLK